MAQRQFLMVDFSEVGAAMGVISGMAATMKTDRYASDVLDMAHNALSRDFDRHMDLLFLNAPKSFHHVYEWGALSAGGGKMTRLWKHTIIGRGASKNASWEWVASKKAIPTPAQRASDQNDPMSQLSEEQLSRFSNRRHWFHWKAPVMEYDVGVTIEPKNSEMIAFPVWDSENPLRFSRGLRNLSPGGDETTGKFTAAWTAWWQQEAPQRFQEIVAPVVENDLVDVANSMRQAKRSRTKTVTLNAMASYEQAFGIGEDWAQQALRTRSTGYKRRFKDGN